MPCWFVPFFWPDEYVRPFPGPERSDRSFAVKSPVISQSGEASVGYFSLRVEQERTRLYRASDSSRVRAKCGYCDWERADCQSSNRGGRAHSATAWFADGDTLRQSLICPFDRSRARGTLKQGGNPAKRSLL